MSVPYTILGVLMDAPAHGYSIRKQLEAVFSTDLGLNDGQLYPALAKLETLGWIAKEVVEQPRSPTKHLYRVTDEGRAAFARWLEGDAPADAAGAPQLLLARRVPAARELLLAPARARRRRADPRASRPDRGACRAAGIATFGAGPRRGRPVSAYDRRVRRASAADAPAVVGRASGEGHGAEQRESDSARGARPLSPKMGEKMFESVEQVQKRLLDQSYIAGKKIATVVYLASKLNKPVLVEGPAGVGKTELAKVVALAVGRPLIRLQCYEGLDESKALYEWEYSKQLLYTQMLRDKISDVIAGTKTLKEASERIGAQDDVFFSERFIVARPLLQAITSHEPICLLIDEVDKSDPEFEAFLLEVLSDYPGDASPRSAPSRPSTCRSCSSPRTTRAR